MGAECMYRSATLPNCGILVTCSSSATLPNCEILVTCSSSATLPNCEILVTCSSSATLPNCGILVSCSHPALVCGFVGAIKVILSGVWNLHYSSHARARICGLSLIH